MGRTIVLWLAIVAGCERADPAPEREPVAPPVVTPPEPAAPPVDLRSFTLVATSVGSTDTPLSVLSVVAVHLAPGAPDTALEIALDVPPTAGPEAWPAAIDGGARWHVQVSAEGGATAPDGSDCGYDADRTCIEALASRHGEEGLFVRWESRAPLPVAVRREADGLVVRAPVRVLRVTRTSEGESALATLEAAPDVDVVLAAPTPLPAGDDGLDAVVAAGDLAPTDAAAVLRFLRAPGGAPGDALTHRPLDALYYWLPTPDADAFLGVTTVPAGAPVHRTTLVRVSLDPVARRSGVALRHDVVEVSGPGREERARHVVLRRVRALDLCATLAASWDAPFPADGTLELRLEVDATGRVARASATSRPHVAALDACTVDTVSGWTFPAEMGAGEVTARITFREEVSRMGCLRR